VVVSAQIVFNNLVEINDIAETFNFDCKFRLVWQDNRFNISQLFPYVNPATASNGIEIIEMYNSQATPLQIWKPDIHFVDAQQIDTHAETFRIKEDGELYYSRHLTLTISQSGFSYRDYPLDQQTAEFRFESYSYPVNLLTVNFVSPPVQFYQSPKSSTQNFFLNPLWSYDSWSTTIEYPNYQFTVVSPPRTFSSAYIGMVFTRRSSGILLRLALPIMFVCVISGVMFWADKEKRLDFTVTLLLTVSALYVSIIQGIPLVGYATSMDTFVFAMFIILLFSVLLHILGHLMTKKEEETEEAGQTELTATPIDFTKDSPTTTRDSLSKRKIDVDSDDEDNGTTLHRRRSSLRYNNQQQQPRESTTDNTRESFGGTANRSLESSAVVIEKKRLHARHFLNDCLVLFGRLVIPVLPLLTGFIYYQSTFGNQSVIVLIEVIFSIGYALLIYVAVFIYSRKRLAKKLSQAIKLIERDTNRGKNVMYMDLVLLYLYDVLHKRKKKREKEYNESKGVRENPMNQQPSTDGIAMTDRSNNNNNPSDSNFGVNSPSSGKAFLDKSRAGLKADEMSSSEEEFHGTNPKKNNDYFNQRTHYQESDVIFKRVYQEK
jgi:hypothetical protein